MVNCAGVKELLKFASRIFRHKFAQPILRDEVEQFCLYQAAAQTPFFLQHAAIKRTNIK
jgi:hypothetical protein